MKAIFAFQVITTTTLWQWYIMCPRNCGDNLQGIMLIMLIIKHQFLIMLIIKYMLNNYVNRIY